jgi:hypothetical protein
MDRRTRGLLFQWPVLALAGTAAALTVVGPRGYEAGWLIAMRDDPAALAGHAMAGTLNGAAVARGIDEALAADDPDLAESFVELARDRAIDINESALERVAAATSSVQNLRRFARGFVTGEAQSAPALAGAATGDLLIFGDARDAAREGIKALRGEEVDRLLLALSAGGLAVTAACVATLGAGAPARAGLTTFKAAYKSGRLGRGLIESFAPLVRRITAKTSSSDAAMGIRAARAEFMKSAVELGRVQSKAGFRAAMDGLQLAHRPADLTRLAKLSEKEGRRTRAILKLAGRAALVVTVATVDLVTWLASAVLALFGFCAAVKSATERATYAYLGWRKRRAAVPLSGTAHSYMHAATLAPAPVAL